MQHNFAASLALVLKSEGGFVDDPRDPGGATNLGITLATLAGWRGVTPQHLGVAAVKALTPQEAGAIYQAKYWAPVEGDSLPDGIDYCTFDYGVNSGPGTAAKALQRVLGVTVDGAIGAKTIAAAHDVNAAQVINRLCDERLAALKQLPTWPHFGAGWTSRIWSVRQAALKMAAAAP